MTAVSLSLDGVGRAGHLHAQGSSQVYTFDAVYDRYAPFVWRSVCRLGVPDHAADDVLQEVFLVVHRLLPEFEERSSIVSWLYAIVIRIVRQYRRGTKRKSPTQIAGRETVDPDALVDRRVPSPLEQVERQEAVRLLHAALDRMNDERREVFVLTELEELSAPEIAEVLSLNINTVYWRLRAARQEFDKILSRLESARSRSKR